ncbi:MAG: flagellar basal-body rod protein FlgF [Clostridiaceae bacterium]|jgi:flagellar basal-body rod protein FlgG|nr:flagellar basal-body rod protein FlgF [Clostridiaceae bacterium]
MVRGLYTAGTGMLTQRNKINVIANNVANVDTVGYKEDLMLSRSFSEVLIERINDPNILRQNEIVGTIAKGVHVDEVFTKFVQGSLNETRRNADLALQGDGFFVVETPNGLRYTRNGAFFVDNQGMLVTAEGYHVQGANGSLYVGSNNFKVNENGQVFDEDGNLVDEVLVVSFVDNSLLRKEGEGLYYTFGEAETVESEAKVKQGYLEASNVDLVDQIITMIEVARAYESNQRVISTIDSTLDKAVNEIGKV